MKNGRGFTMVELGAVLAVVGVAGSVGLVAAGQPRDQARQKKDESQVRGIIQGMVVWAQNNGDRYPLPSVIDKGDKTIEMPAVEKNTTGNIFSLMVYNGSISTEVLVSPSEKNPDVEVKQDYEFDQPRKAAKPAEAIWDPTLSAGLGPKKGNISYAHLQPFAGRMGRWSNTFVSAEPIVGNRGPQVRSVSAGPPGKVVTRMVKGQSIASLLYGDGVVWSGLMGFNDDHVEFWSGTLGNGKAYTSKRVYEGKGGSAMPDVWCFDEPADSAVANDYLGLFVKAGAKREDWKGAWD